MVGLDFSRTGLSFGWGYGTIMYQWPLNGPRNKNRFRRGVKEEDENAVYTETAAIAVLLALVWPVVILSVIVVYTAKSMAATMKAAVKLSSKE